MAILGETGTGKERAGGATDWEVLEARLQIAL
jgi:hypothetical protein